MAGKITKVSRHIITLVFCVAIVFASFDFIGISRNAKAEEPTIDVWDGAIASEFAGGDGTQEHPYQIATGAQLAKMNRLINNSTVNATYGACYYELIADIDLNYLSFLNPTGFSANYSFSGGFDGNNHTIYNFYSRASTYAGFFGYFKGSYIKNLNLVNVDVASTTKQKAVGALVGMVEGEYVEISNITVSGTVCGVGSETGGIIGRTMVTELHVDNCINNADVSSTNIYTGGIIGGASTGDIISSVVMENSLFVTNCVNNGNISGKSSVGGIVGADFNPADYSCCANNGDITVSGNNKQPAAGGISGSSPFADFNNCLNTGNIVCEDGVSTKYIGGILGMQKDAIVGNMTSCMNIVKVPGAGIVGSSEDESVLATSMHVIYCVCVQEDYINTDAERKNDHDNYLVTEEQLASGFAAYVLNRKSTYEQLSAWYQNLGEDAYPVLDNGHALVYADGNCFALTGFTNDPQMHNTEHDHALEYNAYKEPMCGVPGVKEHYECTACGKLFDETGRREVSLNSILIDPDGVHPGYDEDGICVNCGGYHKPEKNADGYYEIYNLGDFLYYAETIVNKRELENPEYSGSIYREPTGSYYSVILMSDIDLSRFYGENGKSWLPLGGERGYFIGEFNGNGHSISGLYINSETISYAGLIGQLACGISCVHDLTLKDVYIKAPNAYGVGGIAAGTYSHENSPTIMNCFVENGTIIGKKNVGGIVGYSTSGFHYNEEDVVLDEDFNIADTSAKLITVIVNCGNNASIIGETNVGGIVGEGTFYVNKCFNTGDVTATTDGVAGSIAGIVTAKSFVGNAYYLAGEAFGEYAQKENLAFAEQKSEKQFASGEVTYLMNGGTSEGNLIWHQNIDNGKKFDATPVLDATHGVVSAAGRGFTNGEASSQLTYSHTLTLQSNLTVNYYVLTERLRDFDNVTLHVVKDVYDRNGVQSEAEAILVGELVSGGTEYKFRYTGIASYEVGNEIRAFVVAEKDGEEYRFNVDTYSIKTYCYRQLAKSTSSDKLKTLIIDLLNYASCSQQYFGIRTDALVNSDLTDEQRAWGSTQCNELSNNSGETVLAGATATISGKTLVLGNNVELKVYMKLPAVADKSKITLRLTYTDMNSKKVVKDIPFEEFAYNEKDDEYSARYAGVIAPEFRNVISIAIYDNGKRISNLHKYSIATYAYNRVNSSSSTELMKNLVKAMMMYSDSAVEYFAK